MQISEDDRCLKVSVTAQRLGMSKSTVYQLIATGQLPSVQIGKTSVRVPAKALERWIEARTRIVEDCSR